MTAAWARHGDLGAVSPAEARRIAEEVREPWTRGGPKIASITESTVAGVRLRIYAPTPDAATRAFVYLHGGGWTLFSIDTHDRLMREYASRANVSVIGVDYALSPEAKFPVALEQVVAVARHFGDLGVTLAVGGDSAGANLAIAACIRLRDEGRPRIVRAMVLNYGVFDRLSSDDARWRLGGRDAMLTAEEMNRYWNNYLRDDCDAENPLACPLRGDLRALPRTLLVVPELDLLAEQSVQLAGALRAAAVPVELRTYRGGVHSFLEAVSISGLADRALAESAAWLRTALDSNGS